MIGPTVELLNSLKEVKLTHSQESKGNVFVKTSHIQCQESALTMEATVCAMEWSFMLKVKNQMPLAKSDSMML
jgi:hypothetical protein